MNKNCQTCGELPFQRNPTLSFSSVEVINLESQAIHLMEPRIIRRVIPQALESLNSNVNNTER